MARIREILLTQYIGAIVIGFIVAQGLLEMVGLAMLPVRWYLQGHNSGTQSVLFNQAPSQVPFPWQSALSGFTTLVLYFGVSYAFARWSYPAIASPMEGSEQVLPSDQRDENG